MFPTGFLQTIHCLNPVQQWPGSIPLIICIYIFLNVIYYIYNKLQSIYVLKQSVVRRLATLCDWQKCKVIGHTMTYWNGISGNGAQRSYQVFQVTPLALQCESQIRERRSKHPSVLTWVCSQIRSGVPVPLTHQRLTILPAQGPLAFYSVSQFSARSCWFSTASHSSALVFYCCPLHTIPSRMPTHSRHSPSLDVLSAAVGPSTFPCVPSSTICALFILQLSLKTLSRLMLILQMHQNQQYRPQSFTRAFSCVSLILQLFYAVAHA